MNMVFNSILTTLFGIFFVSPPVSAAEKPACILAASEEIFRLMKVHEPVVANDKSHNVQVDVKEIEHEKIFSRWASCGYEKYSREQGPITKQYIVRLDSRCHVVTGKEEVRESSFCPKSF